MQWKEFYIVDRYSNIVPMTSGTISYFLHLICFVHM
jgi:hypothetical protein